MQSYFVFMTITRGCKYVHPSLIIHRLSIDNPSIVHRFDGEAMEKRWRISGIKVFSSQHEKLLLHDERQKKGFPRKAKGDFLGGIVFFVYLCTQKQIEHKGTKTQSLNISDSASLRLTKTKRR